MLNDYSDLKIFMASSDDTGCGFYRIKQPGRFLSKFFPVFVNMGFPAGHPALEAADVIILQRVNHELFLDQIPKWQAEGKKVILDMDDNIWEIPATNLSHRFYPKEVTKRMSKIVEMVDALTTSTIPLAEYMMKWNKNIIIVPNMLETIQPFREHKKNDLVTVGWGGSYTHNGDFDYRLVNYLRDNHKKKRFKFTLLGFKPQYLSFADNFIDWVDANNYQETLYSQNIDIGLAVTTDNMFNKCKSNLKFLEYSATSTVTVADSAYPYVNTIEHQKTGFIVKNHKYDWREYIDRLIDDVDYRNEILLNAYNFVNENFIHSGGGTEKQLIRYKALFDFLYKKETYGLHEIGKCTHL